MLLLLLMMMMMAWKNGETRPTEEMNDVGSWRHWLSHSPRRDFVARSMHCTTFAPTPTNYTSISTTANASDSRGGDCTDNRVQVLEQHDLTVSTALKMAENKTEAGDPAYVKPRWWWKHPWLIVIMDMCDVCVFGLTSYQFQTSGTSRWRDRIQYQIQYITIQYNTIQYNTIQYHFIISFENQQTMGSNCCCGLAFSVMCDVNCSSIVCWF